MKRYKELLIIVSVILLTIIFYWNWIVKKDVLVSHDTLRFYGVFAYFADNLMNGQLPLWNPYMNCGEPFFLCINALRLWDPQTIFLVILLKIGLIKVDFIDLYQIDLFIRYLIFIIGGYFFFRHTLKYWVSAFVCFLVFGFSSMSSTYLQQHAFILTAYLSTWILLFAIKAVESRDFSSYILFAFFLGWNLPAYNAMFTMTFLIIFCISAHFTKAVNIDLKNFIKDYKAILLSFLILLFLAFRIVLERDYFVNYTVPRAREMIPNIAYSRYLDFMGLFLPNYFIDGFWDNFGLRNSEIISEAYLYIGLLPLVFMFLGIFYSENKYRPAFLITAFLLIFLMIGTFYPLLCRIIPFLNTIRNMHTFYYFFIFCLCFFVGIGVDAVVDIISSQERPVLVYLKKPIIIINILIISLCIFYVKREFSSDFSKSLKLPIMVTFYIFYSLYSFLLLGCKGISVNRKFGIIIIFVLIDLFASNYYTRACMTIPNTGQGLPTLPKGYQDTKYPLHRLKEWEIPDDRFSRFSYDAAIYKKHVAGIPYTNSYDSHFIELKDYNALKVSKISQDILDIVFGIKQPIFRLVSRCAIVRHAEIINILKDIDKKTIERVILLEKNLPEEFGHLEIKPGEKIDRDILDLGNIEILDYSENEVLLNVDAKQDVILYFSDGYDKYWDAYVNNNEVKIYKANLNFKAVLLKKGNNVVHFLYNPRLYRLSIFIYIATVIAIPLLLIYWKYRRK